MALNKSAVTLKVQVNEAREAFAALCKDFKRFNVSGALTDREQWYLTKHLTDLSTALGVPCPVMVAHKEKK